MEYKLIVAGGRDFHRYEAVDAEITRLATNELLNHNVSIVSGMALPSTTPRPKSVTFPRSKP